jgi:thymidylate synthase
LDLLKLVLEEGEERSDRTGVGTISLFSPPESRYDLREGFPLLTTKDLSGKRWEGIVRELLWFLSGSTNCRELERHKIPIWSAWADSNGDLGPLYGQQWRSLNTYEYKSVPTSLGGFEEIIVPGKPIDQIANLIKGLKEDPYSRRHLVSAWNVGELSQMKLNPCHHQFQCDVTTSGYLDLKLNQRSNDLGLGTSYNVASYSILLTMLAQVTGLKPRYFIHSYGSAHIYLTHIEKLKEQLTREPKEPPTLILNPDITNIDDFTYEDIQLEGYTSWPAIKLSVAV